MFRFLARIAGLLALAAGFAALIIDGTRSIAAHAVVLTPFGDLLRNRIPDLQQSIVRNIHPLLWDPVTVDLLRLPIWVVLAIAGGLLLWLARRRPPPIGYSSRP